MPDLLRDAFVSDSSFCVIYNYKLRLRRLLFSFDLIRTVVGSPISFFFYHDIARSNTVHLNLLRDSYVQVLTVRFH